MRTVLLSSPGFLGDEVVYTGVVRELKRETGWNFRIKTSRPELWKYHDGIVGIDASGDEDCFIEKHHCPSYYMANQTPSHYLEQYLGNMRSVLGLTGPYRISRFAGEVNPSPEEMLTPPFDLPPRYWIIAAGWKPGVPAKAWPTACYQQVVDELRGRISFVQSGVRTNWHPPLRGVCNVMGMTSIRQLIHLVYHAEGIVCPITSIMHMAAAVPASPKSGFSLRPCVVIAGGREAPQYIAYPMHRVLSMVGQLECCAKGGCGKSRFGEGQCPHPVRFSGNEVPKCMTLIKPADVVQAIEFFYRGNVSIPRRIGYIAALLRRLKVEENGPGKLYGVEVGSGRGDISSQLLRAYSNLHLTMVDSWTKQSSLPPFSRPQRYFDELKAAAISNTDFAASRRRMVFSSLKAASQIPDESLDFVFFNSDLGTGLLENNVLAWRQKIRPGGFVCGNRYQDGVSGEGGARRVVDGLAQLWGWKLEKDKADSWFIQNIRQSVSV